MKKQIIASLNSIGIKVTKDGLVSRKDISEALKSIKAESFDWKLTDAPKDDRLIGDKIYTLEGPAGEGYAVGLVGPLLSEWAYSVDIFSDEKASHSQSGKDAGSGVEKTLDAAKNKVEQIFKSMPKS